MAKRKPNAAFMKPVTPDDALAAVVGAKPLPRTELTKKLWDYIKKNGLQDKKEKTKINADDKLKAVFNGKKTVTTSQQQVMPAFGENVNVMCYLDDIYVYLKARADGALPRGRPGKREEKPAAATKNEETCFGRS